MAGDSDHPVLDLQVGGMHKDEHRIRAPAPAAEAPEPLTFGGIEPCIILSNTGQNQGAGKRSTVKCQSCFLLLADHSGKDARFTDDLRLVALSGLARRPRPPDRAGRVSRL